MPGTCGFGDVAHVQRDAPGCRAPGLCVLGWHQAEGRGTGRSTSDPGGAVCAVSTLQTLQSHFPRVRGASDRPNDVAIVSSTLDMTRVVYPDPFYSQS